MHTDWAVGRGLGMRDRDRGRETQVGEAGRGHRDSGAGAATGAGSAAGAEQGPESSARGRSGDPEAGTGDRQRAATALGRQPTAPQRHHRTPARRARSGRSGRRRRRRRKRWRRRRDLPLPPTPTPGEINYSQPSRSRLRAPHPGSGRRGRRSRSGQRSLLRARKGRGRPYLAPLLSAPLRAPRTSAGSAGGSARPVPPRPVRPALRPVPSRRVSSRPAGSGEERSGAAAPPCPGCPSGAGGSSMERRRGVPGGWPCLLAALGALLAAGRAATPRARFSPFFFLCTHHGELEGDGEQGEVLIALHIAGNPAAYVPGQEYHGKWRPRVESLRASPGGHPRRPQLPPSSGLRSRRRIPTLRSWCPSVPASGAGERVPLGCAVPPAVPGVGRARGMREPRSQVAAGGRGREGRAGNAATAALCGHPEVRRNDRAPPPPLRKANFRVRNVSNSWPLQGVLADPSPLFASARGFATLRNKR